MAIYRTIQLSFWTDNKILDEFTPEDKYFYLYLFTNPQTNLCGCYELSFASTVSQTGYNKDTILRLLERFENVHEVLKYSKRTKEVLLLNWHKYNWQGGKQVPCIAKEIEKIKDKSLREIMVKLFEENLNSEGAYKGLHSPYQATVTVTVNNTVNDSFKEIIDYLNSKTNSNYTYKSKSTNSMIKARLEEGFTVEDFKTVIDKKTSEWLDDPKMSAYLRPSTLFAPSKFEGYLNQKVVRKSASKNAFNDIAKQDYGTDLEKMLGVM